MNEKVLWQRLCVQSQSSISSWNGAWVQRACDTLSDYTTRCQKSQEDCQKPTVPITPALWHKLEPQSRTVVGQEYLGKVEPAGAMTISPDSSVPTRECLCPTSFPYTQPPYQRSHSKMSEILNNLEHWTMCECLHICYMFYIYMPSA